jgi:hypothetical protein
MSDPCRGQLSVEIQAERQLRDQDQLAPDLAVLGQKSGLVLVGLMGTRHLWSGRRLSKQPKPPERLLDRGHLLRRARILCGCCFRRYEAELLFAVQNPRALGHEAVLA